MAQAAVLFDLDGTLIDSAPSILAGFGQALELAGMAPAAPLTPALIGPPLRQALARLCGSDDPAVLDRLAGHFKSYYDSEGYRLSVAYPDTGATLQALHAAGVALHLATNKRHAPTLSILAHLGWLPWFSSVYALDSTAGGYADKRAMLAAQLADHGIDAARACYVGDRDEDRDAATGNGLPFIGVDWGYGAFASGCGHPVLHGMAELPALLGVRA